MARIGLLALQGGYAAHRGVLETLGHQCAEVRTASDLEDLDGLVLPGGESTTQLKLIALGGLEPALDRFVESGRPVLATCAGLILAARRATSPQQHSFAWIDVVVRRNAHGRQLESFEATSDRGMPLVFIRAPRIVEVGEGVEVLDTWQGEAILVRQRAITAACFHPELAPGCALHRLVFGPTAVAGASVKVANPKTEPRALSQSGESRARRLARLAHPAREGGGRWSRL